MSHTLPGKTWGQFATSPRGVSIYHLQEGFMLLTHQCDAVIDRDKDDLTGT